MQAARGASLSGAADGAPTGDQEQSGPVPATGATAGRLRYWLVFALVGATAYAIDVVTKVVAVAQLQDRPDVSVVGDLLVLRLVRNPGAAFSAGTEYTVVLSCVAIVAVAAVLVLSLRLRDRTWAIGLGLLLAGVAGNLTDRLVRDPGPLRGHVIDFLRLPNWPVFNVADMCIIAAAGLIILQAFRGVRLDGSRVEE